MAQTLVKLDLNWSTKLIMDSKKAEQLLQLVSEALTVEDRYDGYLVQCEEPTVEITLVGKRKLVSKAKYEEMKAEAEQAKPE